MKLLKFFGIVTIALINLHVAVAETGDRLYIQKNVVNIRKGPGINNPVLMILFIYPFFKKLEFM